MIWLNRDGIPPQAQGATKHPGQWKFCFYHKAIPWEEFASFGRAETVIQKVNEQAAGPFRSEKSNSFLARTDTDVQGVIPWLVVRADVYLTDAHTTTALLGIAKDHLTENTPLGFV